MGNCLGEDSLFGSPAELAGGEGKKKKGKGNAQLGTIEKGEKIPS